MKKQILVVLVIGIATIIIILIKRNQPPYTEKEIRNFLNENNKELTDVANYVLSKCTFNEDGKLNGYILISFYENSSDIMVLDYKDNTVIDEYKADYLDSKIIPSIKKILNSKIEYITVTPGRWDKGGACVQFAINGNYSFYETQKLVYVPSNTIIQEGVGNFVKLSDHWYYNYILENPK